MNTETSIKILTVAVVLSFVCTAGVAIWLNNQCDCKEGDTVYRLYVGLSDDSGEEIDYDEAVIIAGNIIMDYGDGMTVSKATGSWRDDDGSIDFETSMVIDLAGFDLDKIHKICDQLKKDLKQKSIMIVSVEETVEFY